MCRDFIANSSLTTPGSVEIAPAFSATQSVVLHSLSGRPELNGACGTILSYDKQKGRYGVKVKSGAATESVLLKPSSLKLKKETMPSEGEAHVQQAAADAKDVAITGTSADLKKVFVEYGGGLWAEGMDSYHFEWNTDQSTCSAHISYASYDKAARTRFDDGSMPPSTKEFVDTSFDARQRCFRGTVDWSPRCWRSTTSGGDETGSARVVEEQRWEFEIYFAAGYGTIARGEVRDYSCRGELVATHRFGEEGWQYANQTLPEVRQRCQERGRGVAPE